MKKMKLYMILIIPVLIFACSSPTGSEPDEGGGGQPYSSGESQAEKPNMARRKESIFE